LRVLMSYMSMDFKQYMDESKQRLEGKDRSALISLYIMGLVILKLASYLMSQTAEDIYQRYFRGLEPEPSVHVLPWPEPVLNIIT
jgi:isoleucyl-tRNA synthetase